MSSSMGRLYKRMNTWYIFKAHMSHALSGSLSTIVCQTRWCAWNTWWNNIWFLSGGSQLLLHKVTSLCSVCASAGRTCQWTANTSILKVGTVRSNRVISTVNQESLWSSTGHIVQMDWTTSKAKTSSQNSSCIWRAKTTGCIIKKCSLVKWLAVIMVNFADCYIILILTEPLLYAIRPCKNNISFFWITYN